MSATPWTDPRPTIGSSRKIVALVEHRGEIGAELLVGAAERPRHHRHRIGVEPIGESRGSPFRSGRSPSALRSPLPDRPR